jgi:hypothetical protein
MHVDRALRRIRDAGEDVDSDTVHERLDLYEKTLEAVADVTPEDDDEGVTVVTEWVLDYLDEHDALPSSTAVRDRAAEYCRENDNALPDDSWLVT